MKKALNFIFGLIIITTLFSVGNRVYDFNDSINLASTNQVKKDLTVSQEQSFTVYAELLDFTISNASSTNLNTYSNSFWNATNNINQLIEASFNQYIQYALNILINFQKTKLIFPFHYFW